MALLTGIEGDIPEAMKKMNSMGVKDIIMTLGSKGSALWDGKNIEIIPAKKANAVDATAAGDSKKLHRENFNQLRPFGRLKSCKDT